MEKFNYSQIEKFAKEPNMNTYETVYTQIEYCIDLALKEIRDRNPLIDKAEIYVANELFSGAETPNSQMDLFLVLDANQIELNREQKKNFKDSLKSFWDQFISKFKIIKTKKGKTKKFIKQTEQATQNLQKYSPNVFYNDLLLELMKILSTNTKIGISKNKITIISVNDFGVKINLYPVYLQNDGNYRLYKYKSQEYTDIDFIKRFDNINKKYIKTDGLNIQLRIFNNLFYNLFDTNANQIFMESLLYNCPSSLFTNNIINSTIGILNYLRFNNLNEFVSVRDKNIKLFDDSLNTVSLSQAKKFLYSIDICKKF